MKKMIVFVLMAGLLILGTCVIMEEGSHESSYQYPVFEDSSLKDLDAGIIIEGEGGGGGGGPDIPG
ncbi:MAG: hypothetical protein HXS44_11650 [Theionarchaea archaeon]|nr:hypothetical protein [Theionarchaea archaeon]